MTKKSPPIFERKKKREEKREKRKKRKLQDVRKQRRKGLRQDKEMSRSPEGEGRRINSKRQKHRGTKKFSLRWWPKGMSMFMASRMRESKKVPEKRLVLKTKKDFFNMSIQHILNMQNLQVKFAESSIFMQNAGLPMETLWPRAWTSIQTHFKTDFYRFPMTRGIKLCQRHQNIRELRKTTMRLYCGTLCQSLWIYVNIMNCSKNIENMNIKHLVSFLKVLCLT